MIRSVQPGDMGEQPAASTRLENIVQSVVARKLARFSSSLILKKEVLGCGGAGFLGNLGGKVSGLRIISACGAEWRRGRCPSLVEPSDFARQTGGPPGGEWSQAPGEREPRADVALFRRLCMYPFGIPDDKLGSHSSLTP
mmetsp:Transcript_56836/g.176267  ORF Transcript_56836/g.176267 Transcript_56836/m.176267 type:complete len:140 (+) Transcript_56836:1280-1699(+)